MPGQAQQALSANNPDDCQISAEELYARKSDSVVQIISFGIDPHRVAGRFRPGTGSGIVLEPFLVLTNYHVVQGAELIGVEGEGGQYADAYLIGGDPALDIALLELSSPIFTREAVHFGAYSDLAIGQSAYTIGYPLGIGKSLSGGMISGLDRLIPLNTISWTTRYIQTDAAVSGGNSGGALMDGCGRIIGMVSLRSIDPTAENLGYVLPADTFLPLLDEIRETGRVARPWHGLYGQMMSPLIKHLSFVGSEPPPNGFLVETVEPGSAADEAGLRGGIFPVLWGMQDILLGGDVITKVNGRPVETLEDALAAVAALEIGKTVDLTFWREGAYLETSAMLRERPSFDSDLWITGQ